MNNFSMAGGMRPMGSQPNQGFSTQQAPPQMFNQMMPSISNSASLYFDLRPCSTGYGANERFNDAESADKASWKFNGLFRGALFGNALHTISSTGKSPAFSAAGVQPQFVLPIFRR